MSATIEHHRDLLRRCSFPNFGYELTLEGEHVFLRVIGAGTCNVTGALLTWRGRKWRLSGFMTDGEVVQTAFLATMTAIEHEARERFRFDGVSVFDPHYDIHKLVELRQQADAIKERDPPPDPVSTPLHQKEKQG